MGEESEGQSQPARPAKIVEGAVRSSSSPTLTARGAVIRGSRSVGSQTWSVEYGQWQIEAADAEHKRTEEQKENELRRFILRAIVVLLLVTFCAAAIVGVVNDDPSTRQWAQGIVTALLGGLLGAIGGYFTAKSGH
jgi:heme A synthase